MTANLFLKEAARRLGVFSQARKLYRRFSPEVEMQTRGDKALYSHFIQNGDLVFDIGTNLGKKAEIFLALGGRVIGLEPNPLCHPILDYEFGNQPNFTCVPKAVGAKPGHATLHFVNTAATASLRTDWAFLTLGGEKPSETQVEVTTLDALIEEFGKPKFCKIDVEGFEPEVFQGLSQSLEMISFEYHREELQRMNQCLDKLASLGPVFINLIVMEEPDLAFRKWKTREEFNDFIRGGELPFVGDIFVSTKPRTH